MSSTYLSLNVHLVFATKNRAPMIADEWRQDLHAYIAGSLRGLGANTLAVGGIADHVHALASLKATHGVADLVREIKKSSNNWARERVHAFSWQEGYAALSVNANEIPRLVKYIANQEEHHRVWTSADELRELLLEYGISIDERFFE